MYTGNYECLELFVKPEAGKKGSVSLKKIKEKRPGAMHWGASMRERTRGTCYSASSAFSSGFSSGATSISVPRVSAADFMEREMRRRSRSMSMTLT